MLNQIKSVLLNTSASTDVQYVGREIVIQGLEPIKVSRVVDFSQINYRAEVAQVVKLAGTSYTPMPSTRYVVTIGDPTRRVNGGQENMKDYAYTTPSDILSIGANAADQREFIHGKIITAINAYGANYGVAATLGTGTGFTFTDDAGYYPYNRQGMNNRLGANTVRIGGNKDGSGFASNNIVLTTAAVYAIGVGADLANTAPVFDLVTGNLISGNIEVQAPKTIAGAIAITGQRYNLFSISYLADAPLPTIAIGKGTGFLQKNVQVWVDNGTGTSVANLAGYVAFEKALTETVTGLNSNFWNSTGGNKFVVANRAIVEKRTTAAVASGTVLATAADVANGYITTASTSATTITLPTGTLLGAALGAAKGTTHDLHVDNTGGASLVTLAVSVDGILSAAAAAGAGAGFGLLTVPSGATGLARFTLIFSSPTTFTITRTA